METEEKYFNAHQHGYKKSNLVFRRNFPILVM